MDVLRSKSPEMVRKEIWTCLLAYNLIRQTMAQSAQRQGMSPRRLSFAAALEKLGGSWSVLALADEQLRRVLIETQSRRAGTGDSRGGEASQPCGIPTSRDEAAAQAAQATDETACGGAGGVAGGQGRVMA